MKFYVWKFLKGSGLKRMALQFTFNETYQEIFATLEHFCLPGDSDVIVRVVLATVHLLTSHFWEEQLFPCLVVLAAALRSKVQKRRFQRARKARFAAFNVQNKFVCSHFHCSSAVMFWFNRPYCFEDRICADEGEESSRKRIKRYRPKKKIILSLHFF